MRPYAAPSPVARRVFTAYNRRYLERAFHTVWMHGAPVPGLIDDGVPLIVVCSHSMWWDLLLGLYLASSIVKRDYYGVMDAHQLNRYRFFRKLGMIGVDRSSIRGAQQFVTHAADLIRGTSRALYVTPTGEFASLRRRPYRFQPGLAHLVRETGTCRLMTVAFHVEFWKERTPEAFISLGDVRTITGEGIFNRRAFLRAEELILEQHVDRLLADVDTRNSEAFRSELRGSGGASLVYDAARSIAARMRGERVKLDHGDVATPAWRSGSKGKDH